MKVVAYLAPPGSREGNQGGGDAASRSQHSHSEKADDDYPGNYSQIHCGNAAPPAPQVPDWLFYAGPSEEHPAPCPHPASQAANTHAMLVPHFSHVWSLGGVARALEVGREDWGLSELGRKAGVPPGRGGGRQIHQSSSTAAASRPYLLRMLYLLQHAEDTHSYRHTDRGASGVTLVMKVRNVGRKGSRQIFGSGWASAESTSEAELA